MKKKKNAEGMFFTLGEMKNHRLSPFSPYLFSAVAAFKTPVAFSVAQSLNGTHQTGKYVLT